MKKLLATFVSDIHLCHTCPIARSAEPDWYEAMGRVLDQVVDKSSVIPSEKKGVYYNVPIFCAGDFFHKWNSPPELINFAIARMPKMIGIPGQHDLPYHSLDDVRKSAYWTLVEAGTITHLIGSLRMGDFCIHAFPWGKEIERPEEHHQDAENIALVHKYVWTKGHSYPGATPQSHATKTELDGYTYGVFGDNHKGFSLGKVYNCGGLIRRKSDERRYKPAIGMLYDDGSLERHYLDTSEDLWTGEFDLDTSDPGRDGGLTDFLEELSGLDSNSLDFRESVLRYLCDNKVGGRTREILLNALGEEDAG